MSGVEKTGKTVAASDDTVAVCQAALTAALVDVVFTVRYIDWASTTK